MSKPVIADEERVGLALSKDDPALTVATINARLATFGYCRLPDGTINVATPIVVPSNCILEGSALTILNATGTNAVITSSNTTNVLISNLRITRTAGQFGDGIQVYGDDITIRKVTIQNCFTAVLVVDRTPIDGLQSGEITIDRCTFSFTGAAALSSQFGIQMNTVDNMILINTHVSGYWLDGVKARRLVSYFEYIGGSSNDNGQSLGFGASGDGIDCFAGAQAVFISGVTMNDNGGNGIVIKTINNATPATNPSNPQWGYIRSHRIEGCIFNNDQGTGVALEGVVDSALLPGEEVRPRTSMVHVDNCIASNCINYGIFINSFQTTVNQYTSRNCGINGINIGPQARDIIISDCLNWGNGSTVPGTTDNVLVENGAQRVQFNQVRNNGKQALDTDEIITDASYAALPTVSRYPIFVEDGATDITVNDCRSQFHVNDPSGFNFPVATSMASGILNVFHWTISGNPNGRFYGAVGSVIYSQALAGIDSTAWVKTRGTPSDLRGWFQLQDGQDCGWYGTGVDGDVTLGAGTTTMARDMFWNTLRVPNGAILVTNGYRVHVRGNTSLVAGTNGFDGCLTVDAGGIIRNNGNAGALGVGGAAPAAGTLAAGFAGGNGGTAGGTAGTNAVNTQYGAGNGAGGAGGAGTGGAGGAGGTIALIAANSGAIRALAQIASGQTWSAVQVRPGAGGGGGGGDGAAASGGGGGSGGGVMVLCCRSITNNGTIEVLGGAGAPGTAADTGGGGGGAGGLILQVSDAVLAGNAFGLTGGAGGASGGGAGVAGSPGEDGLLIFCRP